MADDVSTLSGPPAYRKATRYFLFCRANGCCEYCGKVVLLPFGTVDHRLPRSLGGSGRRENLAWACWLCNQRKRDMSEERFRKVLRQPGHRAGLTCHSE